MSLNQINIADFRNFSQLMLTPCQDINFIVGENGSGKTSLLEAIYYLSRGRSFNTTNHGKVIRFDQDSFVIRAKVVNREDEYEDELPIGIRRFRNNDIDIRIDGQTEKKVSLLAKILPVQLITPESFKLFFGGPKERRHFFDFGLFHVKQSFYQDWLRFTKIHKHRNALLKKRPRFYNDEFAYWDGEFCRLAEIISDNRQEYLDLFSRQFDEINMNIPSILTDAQMTFQLSKGYQSDVTLTEQLKNAFEKDVKFGYTSVGPHKSDVKIKSSKRLVEDVFSRGQLKLLLYVIKLLQSDIISVDGVKPVMLIDDIGSEVDKNNLKKIFEFLQSSSQTQFFISSLDHEIADYLAEDAKNHSMFHVKHGTIKQTIGNKYE
ncbi:MAG: DNA replication and repair protein RecF [Alteromonadaceae bacterium]|jgi:DNA replication and repair protein RecF